MIRIRRAVLGIFMGALLVLTSAGALFAGADPIGRVTDIQGKVTSTSSAGVEALLALDSPINLMDRIVTAADGKVGIKFNDKTYVAIGPDSDVTIDDYVYTRPESRDNSFNLNVVKGLFMVVAGKIAKHLPESFTVRTRVAMIGIRGTSFAFMYDLSPALVKQFNNTSPKKLRIRPENFYTTNFDGAVYVANEAGTAELDQLCEYCWVRPTKISRLAFLDGVDSGAALFSVAAPEGPEGPPGVIMLAKAKLPHQGDMPTAECDPAVAGQFATFISTVFSGFPGIATSWVHRLINRRLIQLMTPLIPILGPPAGEGEGEGEGCFHPATKVLLANGCAVEISKVRVGDMVKSYNVEKGTVESKLVTELYSFPTDGYYVINGSLKVTEKHPFLMAGTGNIWKKAAELEVGDRVQSVNGEIAIESVEHVKGRDVTYNFLVKDNKAYIVKVNDKLYVVHNGL